MTALVVAMAGTMLPAIALTSNSVCSGIEKTCERKLLAAVTKRSASSSSLSNGVRWRARRHQHQRATVAPQRRTARVASRSAHSTKSRAAVASDDAPLDADATAASKESGNGGGRPFQGSLPASAATRMRR